MSVASFKFKARRVENWHKKRFTWKFSKIFEIINVVILNKSRYTNQTFVNEYLPYLKNYIHTVSISHYTLGRRGLGNHLKSLNPTVCDEIQGWIWQLQILEFRLLCAQPLRVHCNWSSAHRYFTGLERKTSLQTSLSSEHKSKLNLPPVPTESHFSFLHFLGKFCLQ